MYKCISLFILLLCPALIFGQKEGYLQLDAAVSKTTPIRPYSSFPEYYNGGTNVSADIDYFFGFAGLGLSAGYSRLSTTRRTSMLFMSDFIKDHMNADELKWTHRYLMLGPTIKFSRKKLGADVFLKAGVAEVSAPELEHSVNAAGNPYYILSPITADNSVQVFWKAGARLMFNLTSWMGLHLKVETVNSKWVNNTMYHYNYRNVEDTNTDGRINLDEYEIAETLHDAFRTSLSTINFGAGLFFQISPASAKEDKLRDFFASEDADRESVILHDSILLANAEKRNNGKTNGTDNSVAAALNNDSAVNKTLDQKEIETVLNEFYYEKSRDPAYYSYGEKQFMADLNLYEQGFSDYFKKEYLHSFKAFSQIVNKNLFSLTRYMMALNLTEFGKCQEAKVEFAAFESIYGLEDLEDLRNIYLYKIGSCIEADTELDKMEYISGTDVLKKSVVERESGKIEGIATPSQSDNSKIEAPVTDNLNNKAIKTDPVIVSDPAGEKDRQANVTVKSQGNERNPDPEPSIAVVPDAIPGGSEKNKEKTPFTIPEGTTVDGNVRGVEADPLSTLTQDISPDKRRLADLASATAGIDSEPRELTDREKLSLLAGRENLVYRVQFIALSRPNADFEAVKARISDFRVDYFAERGLFRYTTGPYYTLDEAKRILEIARELKYHDAFIAIYDGDERIETVFHGMIL